MFFIIILQLFTDSRKKRRKIRNGRLEIGEKKVLVNLINTRTKHVMCLQPKVATIKNYLKGKNVRQSVHETDPQN